MSWTRLRSPILAVLALAVIVVLALHIILPLPGHDDVYWPWPLGLMAYPVAAYLVLSRRPDNRVGHVLGLVALFSGLSFLTHWTAMTYPAVSAPSELLHSVGAIGQFAAMATLLHIFPTGRPLGARHRRLLAVLVLALIATLIMGVLSPAPLHLSGDPNPFAVLPAPVTAAIRVLEQLLLAALAISGLAVLALRRRRADLLVRAQLRWFFGAALLALLVIFLLAASEVPGSPLAVLQEPLPAFDAVVGVVLAMGIFWGLPAAIVVAVTRYRLYEIDRLLSRTISYVLVAGALVAVYTVGVLTVRSLVPASGDLAVAASTLAVAAAFGPLRARVQGSVNRRFNRAVYQAEQVTVGFARRVRESVDTDAVLSDLVQVVSATLQPVSAGIHLVGQDGSDVVAHRSGRVPVSAQQLLEQVGLDDRP